MENKNPEIKFKKVDPDYSGLELVELEYAKMIDAYGVEKNYKLDFMTKTGDLTEKKPVVFFVHGGGFTEPCDKRQSYISLFAQKLTECGYAVVSPDYPVLHHSEDLEREELRVCCEPLAGTAIHKVVQYLKNNAKELGIDSNRMVLMGGSAGSMAGFYALSQYPNEFLGFVNLWGVPDILPNIRQFPPVLSIHGNCDQLVPFERELVLQKELEEKGIYHKLITLDGYDHTPVRQRDEYLPELLSFLKKVLD